MTRRQFLRSSAIASGIGALPFLTTRGADRHVLENRPVFDYTHPVWNRRPAPTMAVSADELKTALGMACDWLVDIAQVQTETLTNEDNTRNLRHTFWKGAIRGEYSAATRKWDFFCPVWHTGQALKALVWSAAVLDRPGYLDAVRLGAEFIGAQRVSDPSDPDFGMIGGFEDKGDEANTSAMLEASEGLLRAAEATGDAKYAQWVRDSADWILKKAYRGHGYFADAYSTTKKAFVSYQPESPGRPLLDDAVFLRVYAQTKEAKYRDLFYETAVTCLKRESPPGNWVDFWPSSRAKGQNHPRSAYWWGYPMVFAYLDSGKKQYLDCAQRAGEWYIHAQRLDGGMFRNTGMDFNTDSFGHATSGACCAMILWNALWQITGERHWVAPLNRALTFSLNMQFTHPQDPNLKGCILEKVLPPKDGTDASPYQIRDLGTIFFAQALAKILRCDI